MNYNGAKGLYWLQQPPAQFLGYVNGEELDNVFTIAAEGGALKHKNYGIVSTGLPFLIVTHSTIDCHPFHNPRTILCVSHPHCRH